MTEYSRKIAFTIAEALLTFTLIGAIFVVTVSNTAIRPNENYYKLYWQAFNTLYQASKAMENEWEIKTNDKCSFCSTNPDELPCYKAACWRNSQFKDTIPDLAYQERAYLGGTENIDRDFPGFLFNSNIIIALTGRGQDKEFCENLISRINTFPSNRCESFISVANPDYINNNNSQGGIKFLNAFSYVINKEDGTYETVNNKGGISPSFIALNGQKFYISSVVTANTPKKLGPAWNEFEHPSRESYRFVVVDLNGDAKPNSQFKTGLKNPDIVLFAINSLGDVIPLGLPEFSKEYINAVVYYPNDLEDDGKRTYTNIKSKPMTLWAAKSHAWSNQSCGGGGSPLPYGSAVSSAEPLSQSARFYAVATACKNNVKDCENKNAEENDIYADELFVNLVLQFLYKEENSTELYSYLTESDCIKNSKENGCEEVKNSNEVPTCAIDFEH